MENSSFSFDYESLPKPKSSIDKDYYDNIVKKSTIPNTICNNDEEKCEYDYIFKPGKQKAKQEIPDSGFDVNNLI